MNVQFTGTISKNNDVFNTIFDGEHILNNKAGKFCLWVDTFGKTTVKVIPLDLSENQFQIYNNY